MFRGPATTNPSVFAFVSINARLIAESNAERIWMSRRSGGQREHVMESSLIQKIDVDGWINVGERLMNDHS